MKTNDERIKTNGDRGFLGQFSAILMIAAVILMVMPFWGTVNEFMTAVLIKTRLEVLLERFIVPYEARVMAGVLSLFPINAHAVAKGVWVNGLFIELQWNCLGWQSVVVLAATYFTGMKQNFSRISRFEAMLIGILGTYLINFFRLTLVGIFATFSGSLAAIIFHDYFSLVLTIVWFLFFWWFAYSFVLEEQKSNEEKRI